MYIIANITIAATLTGLLDCGVTFRVNLPELPPKNPFFSLNNAKQIATRMEGLRHFLKE